MKRSTQSAQGAKKLFGKITPSYLILLSALPFVIYLFVSSEDYLQALKFIAPGISTTIIVAVLAYIVASILGLILASLLILKLNERTLLWFSLAAILMATLSVFFFSRPKLDYSLVGETSGRVAIVKGTPARLSDAIKAGSFVSDTEEPTTRPVRGVDSVAIAFERLEAGIVTAVFVPTEQAPADLPLLWRVSFLPDAARNPAMGLAVFAVITLLLSFAGWQSNHHPLAIFAELYVDMMRGIPMLVIILYVGFPLQGAIRDATGGLINMSLLTRGVVGISLGYAAYMAEIFRAGIEAIPRGQVEASRSLGLSGWQTARFIVLPQALRIVIPPLGNEFIAMLKDTSLLSVISVRDITQRTREFSASTFQVFSPFNTVAILYIALTLAASSMVKWLERRQKRTAR